MSRSFSSLSDIVLLVNCSDLKQLADQGDATAQFQCGLCFQTAKGVSIDLTSAAHYFRLSADQGNADGQCSYGRCLQDGKGVSIDLRSAAHYLKLSADQGNADGHCSYGICLLNGEGVSIDLRSAAHYFKLSADQGLSGLTTEIVTISSTSGTVRDIRSPRMSKSLAFPRMSLRTMPIDLFPKQSNQNHMCKFLLVAYN
jgi:hypothetical protein